MATVLGKQGQEALKSVQRNSGAVGNPMTITVVPIDSVKLWKENPRKNDTAVPKLMKILAEHGQRSPIVVWDKNNVIYKGNTTWKACKALGWKTIQVCALPFPSEASASAYGIADNKSSEWSEWDDSVLSGILRSNETFFGTENTGFTEKELTALKLSSEMPDKLDASSIIGDSNDMGDFIIIRFETSEQAQEYRDFFGMKGNEKVLTADKLQPFLA